MLVAIEAKKAEPVPIIALAKVGKSRGVREFYCLTCQSSCCHGHIRRCEYRTSQNSDEQVASIASSSSSTPGITAFLGGVNGFRFCCDGLRQILALCINLRFKEETVVFLKFKN